MPRIPLYNQGAGPSVGVASGSLGPRASAAAFTAPGRAMAGFQKTISDIGNVAKDFAIEQQNQEVKRVLQEESVRLGREARDKLREDQFTTTNDSRESWDAFNAGQEERIKGSYTNLNNRQMNFLMSNLRPELNRFSVDGEQKAYANGLKIKGDTANEYLQELFSQASVMPDGSPERLLIEQQIQSTIDDASLSGFGQFINYDKSGAMFEVDRQSLTLFAEDDTRTLAEIEQKQQEVLLGEGKYADYSQAQRDSLTNIFNERITFLESSQKVQAVTIASGAAQKIALTGDDEGQGLAAVATLEKLGEFKVAEELRTNLEASKQIYTKVDALTFATDAEVTDLLIEYQQEVIEADVDEIGSATKALELVTGAVAEKRKQFKEDPAGYIQREYAKKNNGTQPTRDEILLMQQKMGVDLDDSTPFTATELSKITSDLTGAENVDDVVTVFNSMFGEETEFVQDSMMRTLSRQGVNPAYQLIAANPNLPSNTGLLQSLNKENLKQKVTDSEKEVVLGFLFANEDFKSHMSSMMGGAFAGMEGVDSYSARSDTTEFSEVRKKQFDMIVDYAIYLADKDGVIIDENAQLSTYIDDAVKVFTDRFEYIENPGNERIVLRLDKRLGPSSFSVQSGMADELNNLVPMFETFDNENAIVIYKPPEFTGQEGTPEHKKELERYVSETQQFGGWVATNSGQAMLLDRNGGLVFEYKSMGNGDPDEIVPVVRSIVDLGVSGEAVEKSKLRSVQIRGTAGKSGRYTEDELRLTAELAGLSEPLVERYIAGESILDLLAEQRRSGQ